MKKSIFLTIFTLLKTTIKKWWTRDSFDHSEIVAYNAIFSLPELLVVILAIAGYFFGADAVSGKLYGEFAQTMGPDTAD
jgi:membrane protein